MSILRDVCVDREGGLVYVATTGGRLRALANDTGELLAEVEVAGLPLAAADRHVIVADRPREHSPGSVSLVRLDDGKPDTGSEPALTVVWTSPLLATPDFERLRHGADSELSADIGSRVVRVVGRFRIRVQGGVEPLDGSIEDPSELVVTAVFDRSTGESVKSEPTGPDTSGRDATDTAAAAEAGAPTASDRSEVSSEPRVVPTDLTVGRWKVEEAGGQPQPVELDPGTEAAQVVDDRILFRVVEAAAEGSGRRRYLRSRPIDPDQGPGWSHLIEQSIAEPPPRRP